MSDKTEACWPFLCLLNFGFQVPPEEGFICCVLISLCSKVLLLHVWDSCQDWCLLSLFAVLPLPGLLPGKYLQLWRLGMWNSQIVKVFLTTVCYTVYLLQKTSVTPKEVCTAESKWDGLGTLFSGKGYNSPCLWKLSPGSSLWSPESSRALFTSHKVHLQCEVKSMWFSLLSLSQFHFTLLCFLQTVPKSVAISCAMYFY